MTTSSILADQKLLRKPWWCRSSRCRPHTVLCVCVCAFPSSPRFCWAGGLSCGHGIIYGNMLQRKERCPTCFVLYHRHHRFWQHCLLLGHPDQLQKEKPCFLRTDSRVPVNIPHSLFLLRMDSNRGGSSITIRMIRYPPHPTLHRFTQENSAGTSSLSC